jgi:glutamate dehydrogenase
VACYRLFINGLLDITDNLADGKVVHPQNCVRHDADDPYLVVAADKGTATFSDIANAISADHGYWLGDAFASGGSVGYDHKGMGITAKGAWESVKRHSRGPRLPELGFHPLSATCPATRLATACCCRSTRVARRVRSPAHLPRSESDAARHVERERMFKLPHRRADYDTKLISKGGGIHPRTAKAIPVRRRSAPRSASRRGRFDVAERRMRAILAAGRPAVNGGIGTYIKAETETNADAGDRANNAIRVNGRIRAAGWLKRRQPGVTWRGRIEAALNGVLLNTDFMTTRPASTPRTTKSTSRSR